MKHLVGLTQSSPQYSRTFRVPDYRGEPVGLLTVLRYEGVEPQPMHAGMVVEFESDELERFKNSVLEAGWGSYVYVCATSDYPDGYARDGALPTLE